MREDAMHFSWILIGLVSLIAICHGVHGKDENTWSCPSSRWVIYDEDEPMMCVMLGSGLTSSMKEAHDICVSHNSSLMKVPTEKKYQYFKGYLRNYTQSSFWLGLMYDNGLKWITKDGYIKADETPLEYPHRRGYNYDNHRIGVQIDAYARMVTHTYNFKRHARYICERRADCHPGWYGMKCDQACHCHGQPCDHNDLQGVCLHGCQLGWMGPSCNEKKENAHMNYYCINSKDMGKYVHIRINTKGVHYETIQAFDNAGYRIDWCENTEQSFDKGSSVKSIKIYIDDNTETAIRNGSCAGQVTEGVFEWHIKLEEIENFVSRNDQEFTISCDFSDADTLTMSGNTELVTRLPHFTNELEVSKETVELRVVDAFTGLRLNKTVIGTSVVLKIRFGLGTDNEATGVYPYDCYATSSDGTHSVQLIDGSGCPVPKSLISSFSVNGTDKALITDPFPMPGFTGTTSVNFNCSYRLCFGQDNCSVKCHGENNQNSTMFNMDHGSRHRRGIRGMLSRLTKVSN